MSPAATECAWLQVWDSKGFVRYGAGLLPDPIMGHVAENNVIQQALMQKLEHSGRPLDKLWPVSSSCMSHLLVHDALEKRRSTTETSHATVVMSC